MPEELKIVILAFAQAREIFGFAEKEFQSTIRRTPREILQDLDLSLQLLPKGTRVAVNGEYTDWDHPLTADSELAIIPPVSGG